MSVIGDALLVGGSSPVGNDVIFYDYDGTVVRSYSKADVLSLPAMPSNPSHPGLTAQGWNWSLSDAKTYVADYDRLNIGQMYITDDGKTRIYIRIEEGRLNWGIGIELNGTVTIDWGDESTPDTGTATYDDGMGWPWHTYSAPGDYVVSIDVTGEFRFGEGSFSPDWGTAINTSVTKIEIGGNCNIEGEYAFAYCGGLSCITIPTGAVFLNEGAFFNCHSLRYVTIPTGMESLGEVAFWGCYSLETISMPNTVKVLGHQCFIDCYSLRFVTIPTSMLGFFSNVFMGCHSLNYITDLSFMEGIDSGAFSGCRSLKSISAPPSIGNSCFSGCDTLAHATIADTDTLTSLTGTFSDCRSLRSFTIPDSVTYIGEDTFARSGIENITIPANVTGIGAYAFAYPASLGEIHFLPTTPPTAGNYAFSGIPTDCVIYVPTGSLSAYTSASNYPSPNTYRYIEE